MKLPGYCFIFHSSCFYLSYLMLKCEIKIQKLVNLLQLSAKEQRIPDQFFKLATACDWSDRGAGQDRRWRENYKGWRFIILSIVVCTLNTDQDEVLCK